MIPADHRGAGRDDADPVRASGRVSLKTAPAPGALVTASSTPRRPVSWRAMARPSPAPLPTTPGLAARERLEDALELLGRDARPLVAHVRGGGPGARVDGEVQGHLATGRASG